MKRRCCSPPYLQSYPFSMDNLSIELVEYIALGLPFKNAARLLTLSKLWIKLIKSASFGKMHLDKSTDANRGRSVLLSTIGYTPTRFYKLDFDDDDEIAEHMRSISQPLSHPAVETKVVGHANGLICICNEPKWRPSEMAMWKALVDVKLALWNPSTQRFKRVPMLTVFTIATLPRHMVRYQPVYGFAYNSAMDDYEIILINQFKDKENRTHTSEVLVWTSRSNEWKRIQGLPNMYRQYEVGIGFAEDRPIKCSFVNGHVHWLMENIHDFSWKILALDIKEKEFCVIGLPADVEPNVALRLEALGGHLYLLDHQDDRVNVWRMNEHKNADSWVRYYVLEDDGERIYTLFPIILSKTGRGVLNLGRSNFSCLFWFNPDSQGDETELVLDLGADKDFRATSLVENFLLVDSDPIRQ